MRTLLLGCGSRRTRLVRLPDQSENFDELVTLDDNPSHKPNLVWDLEAFNPLPFPDDSFDEICAFEVLEHIGNQGDYKTFFRQFSDYWRILKPNGTFAASVPGYRSMWAFGDPSHRRIINQGTLVFLDQSEYIRQVGNTPMSDFRNIYQADFSLLAVRLTNMGQDSESFQFVLRAVKPSRCP